jgi:hypothetical protein
MNLPLSLPRFWPVSLALLAVIAALSPANDAAAKEPDAVEDVIEQLFLGETVYPQERFELQASTGIEWKRAGRHVDFAIPVELEFGVTDRFQLAVEAPVLFVRRDAGVIAGVGSVEASAFYNVISRRSLGLSFSAGLGIGSPASARELGSSSFAIRPVIVGYKELGPVHLNVSTEAAIALPSSTEAAEVGVEVALGVFVALGSLIPTLELAGEFEDESELSLAPGLLWHPCCELELGLAVPIGLTKGSAGAGLLLHATWEIDLGGDHGQGGDDKEEASR